MYCLFFFFQAEDGIRDYKVTGVQTCALPIYPGWLRRAGGPLGLPPLMAVTHSCLLRLPEFTEHLHACARWLLDAGADRSEERRVGEEGRSRWAAYYLNKKNNSHISYFNLQIY